LFYSAPFSQPNRLSSVLAMPLQFLCSGVSEKAVLGELAIFYSIWPWLICSWARRSQYLLQLLSYPFSSKDPLALTMYTVMAIHCQHFLWHFHVCRLFRSLSFRWNEPSPFYVHFFTEQQAHKFTSIASHLFGPLE